MHAAPEKNESLAFEKRQWGFKITSPRDANGGARSAMLHILLDLRRAEKRGKKKGAVTTSSNTPPELRDRLAAGVRCCGRRFSAATEKKASIFADRSAPLWV